MNSTVFNVLLFTDGSVDTKTRTGFGAYLVVEDMTLPGADLTEKVKIKKFENTSSTKLELQTLLWALDEVLLLNTEKLMSVTVYSDSQNIVGLPARRSGLEQQEYYASNGRRLNNAEFYQQFFNVMDQLCCHIIKVDGHKPRNLKNDVDRIFALVDKASRLALRKFNNM